ncbi:MAG: MopE-related protein [Myxococcota bacterium]
MRATPLSLLLALALSPATLGSCISSPSQDTSAELRPEFKCADTVDNDDDGLIDCDDPDCPRSCACDPSLCKERCEDNRDNDDDGLVDEGCPCRFNGSSNGVCLNGRLDGAGACSSPEGYQMVETACDGLDNDCDGVPDAGCNCRFDDKSSGVCLFAIVAPTGQCGIPAGFTSPEEGSNVECDGLDNDCDGTIDSADCDACAFISSAAQPGDAPVGVCLAGIKVSLECEEPVSFQIMESLCDGADNDCDGAIDERCPCQFKDANAGVCLTAQRDEEGACAAPVGYQELELNCDDDLDNDCDGAIDCDDEDCGGANCTF